MTLDAQFAAQLREILEPLRSPRISPFLEDWPSRPENRAVAAASLPVLRWLPQVAGDADAAHPQLIDALCRAAGSLAWRQTYGADELDATFLDNYGWTEIIGAAGPLACAELACGFLLLGPNTRYPRHTHPAEELYLPLSGAAHWQQGDGIWRIRPVGIPILHSADEPHAMQTTSEPLLALYLWRGEKLDQKARLS